MASGLRSRRSTPGEGGAGEDGIPPKIAAANEGDRCGGVEECAPHDAGESDPRDADEQTPRGGSPRPRAGGRAKLGESASKERGERGDCGRPGSRAGRLPRLRAAMRLVSRNAGSLLAFEVLYKLISFLVATPLLLGAFSLTMRAAGYDYLSLENLFPFLGKPLTLALILVILLAAAFFSLLDISAVIFALDMGAQDARVTLSQILRFALRNSARVFHGSNFLLIPFVLLLLPFLHIGLASGFLSSISIPEFILDFIRDSPVLLAVFLAALAVLLVLFARWMYALFFFTVDGCSFREARGRSAALGRGKRARDFLALLAMQLALGLLCVLALLAAVALASLIKTLFTQLLDVFVLRWLGQTAVWFAIVLVLAVTAALSVPVCYACVGVLFYKRRDEDAAVAARDGAVPAPSPGHLPPPQPPPQPRHPRVRRAAKGVCIAGVSALALTLGFLLASGRISPDITLPAQVEVTAHRGASSHYPENTMAAFRGALQEGADWIELDVQMTRDGEIVVSHDANLARVTGVDKNIYDLSYEEIAELDAGSHFDPAFAGERIPRLAEVLAFARERGARLNIELKPTGHERGFERAVVDLVREAGMTNRVVLTSQMYEVLTRVKEIDPAVTTVYVMSLAVGDLRSLSDADELSIEAHNLTRRLVSGVHGEGKRLLVWTVNTRESLTRALEAGADNLITDNISLARECITDARCSTLFRAYLKLLR